MKNFLRFYLVVTVTMMLISATNFAQAPNVRSLGCFVLYSTTGAISNTGTSVVNGNVGTGTGAITGFGTPTNVNGSIHNADAITTQASADLLVLCTEINNTATTNSTHSSILGGGETLFPGVYSIDAASSIAGTLTLDAQGDANALFIFKLGGAFSTGAGTTLILLNGAKPCNIFWKAMGAISMAANTDMKGTLIANPGAISLAVGCKISGRLLSSTGAISLNMVEVSTFLGCNGCTPGSGISTWIGNNSVWNYSCNWCGGVPSATTNVEIPAMLEHYPILTEGTAMANNIHIENGGSLIIKEAGILSLYGTLNNAGTLNITDGTLNLAGPNVEVGGNSLFTGIVKNLTISNGGNRSIATGANNMLSVKNNLSFLSSNNNFTTNGNLTLLSSDTLTASVTDMTNDGAFSGNRIEGNASVERFIPASKRWRYLAINTETITGSKNTVQENWMEGATPGSGAMAGRGMWITAPTFTAAPSNFDATSLSPSIKWLNGNNYTGILDPTNYDIRSHPAYFTYVRGDRGATPVNGIVSATILRTFGGLIQGDKSTTIPAGPGYTGTGNPYAAAIDLRKLVFNTTDVINIYVWDPKLGGGYGQGAYQVLTRDPQIDPGFSILPGGGSYGAAGTMNTIESGLGFLVQGSTLGRTLTFKENAKKASEYDAYFIAGNQEKISGALLGQQTDGTYIKTDGLQVRMHSTYLTALDFNDARKFNSSTENIAVLREGVLLTFEYRNLPITDKDTINIHMANMAKKNYRWIFTLANVDNPGRVGVLIDKFTATETILNLDGITSIDFAVTATVESFATDRFIIVLRQLPPVLKLLVDAKRNEDGNVFLNWKAINEFNIVQYQTEKSENGISFTPFGNPSLAVNNNGGNAFYSKQDESNYNTAQYYRIKTTSENLPVQYSEVVKITALEQKRMISVYPNPIQGKTIRLLFSDMPKGDYLYSITDNSGRRITNGVLNVQGRVAKKIIQLSQSISTKSCLLMLINEQGIKTSITLNIAD